MKLNDELSGYAMAVAKFSYRYVIVLIRHFFEFSVANSLKSSFSFWERLLGTLI